jgi:transcriptional regulator with XRE-family HTH domain
MTPSQCKAARGLIGWTQQKLAREGTVSIVTVENFERKKLVPLRSTSELMRCALQRAGVEFIPQKRAVPACGSERQKVAR